MSHLKSLREFIDELEKLGDVQRIEQEVDWNLEAGAVIRRSYDLRAPAPLFTNLTGYQGTGFRLFGAPGALSSSPHPLARIALALGLSAEAPGQQIVEALVAARSAEGIPPVVLAAKVVFMFVFCFYCGRVACAKWLSAISGASLVVLPVSCASMLASGTRGLLCCLKGTVHVDVGT